MKFDAFFHEYTCCGDDNIYFFVNDDISKEAKLFIVNSLNNNKSKYSYGKQFRQGNADTEKVMLPVMKEDNTRIDFDFMENYIRNKFKSKIDLYKAHIEKNYVALDGDIGIKN